MDIEFYVRVLDEYVTNSPGYIQIGTCGSVYAGVQSHTEDYTPESVYLCQSVDCLGLIV